MKYERRDEKLHAKLDSQIKSALKIQENFEEGLEKYSKLVFMSQVGVLPSLLLNVLS